MTMLNCCIKYFYKCLLTATTVFPSFAFTCFYHELLLFTLDFFPKLSPTWHRGNNLLPQILLNSAHISIQFLPHITAATRRALIAVNSPLP